MGWRFCSRYAQNKAILIGLGLLLCFVSCQTSFSLGRNLSIKSITTSFYEVGITKRGKIFVFLSTGEPMLIEGYPSYEIEGDKGGFVPSFSGVASTRFLGSNPAGEGQGILLQDSYLKWRVQTNTTEGVVSFQVVMVNPYRSPLQLKRISPLNVIIPEAEVLSSDEVRERLTSAGVGSELSNQDTGPVFLYHRASGMYLCVGFLSNCLGKNRIVTTEEWHQGQKRIRVVASTDLIPSLNTLSSGQSVASDWVYVGFGESDISHLLRRFQKAVATAELLIKN